MKNKLMDIWRLMLVVSVIVSMASLFGCIFAEFFFEPMKVFAVALMAYIISMVSILLIKLTPDPDY